MLIGASLSGMFLSAFLAATILPFPSEVLFLALIAERSSPVWLIVLVASIGNTLGSCLTYAMGRGLGGAQGARWFPVTPQQMDRATRWFNHYGRWSLLLSWAPGGDVVVAAAGLLRVPLWQFVTLVSIAKTARYIVVALIGLGVFG